jgi:hypothetical protein
MGNVITTRPQRGGDARARAAELTAQYAAQRAAAMQQPVVPNLSYDELVVVEANRRIRAEELRCQAEDLRQSALAEKMRFDADVAERIALQKNPNHVTRAMIAEAAREKARLDKLAAEEHQAKVANNTLPTTQQILMLFEQKDLEMKADAEAKAKAEVEYFEKACAEAHARYEAEKERRKLYPTPDEQWEDKFQEYMKTTLRRGHGRNLWRLSHIFNTRSKGSQKLRSDIRRLAQEGKTHIEIADQVNQVNVKPKDIINFFTLLANNNL